VPLLEARNLVKIFSSDSGLIGGSTRTTRAVDDVSLTIESGETLGLVGESGSGKSTLGRLILRLIEPTSGTVTFGGKNITSMGSRELRALRRDMQIIFQDPFGSLDPRMKVLDIVVEPLIIHNERGDLKQRASELMRAVGMDASALAR